MIEATTARVLPASDRCQVPVGVFSKPVVPAGTPDASLFHLPCQLVFNAPVLARRQRADRLKRQHVAMFYYLGPEAREVPDDLLKNHARDGEFQLLAVRKRLLDVLGDLNDKDVGASLIASFPVEFLRNWCNQNRPNASHILARITPVIVRKDSSLEWHPVARMLLDNFGDDEEMLSELSANWGTFSWTGSLIPYYEHQLVLIRQLANHPTPTVRKWQAQNAEWAQQRIDFERKREEEAQLGIH